MAFISDDGAVSFSLGMISLSDLNREVAYVEPGFRKTTGAGQGTPGRGELRG